MSHKLRAILCAVFGHPRVIEQFMGECTCARCDAILGDTLAGVYDASDKVLVGHDCAKCDAARARLKWHEHLMTRGLS